MTEQADPTTEEVPTRSNRRRYLLIGAAVAALAIAGTVVWLVTRQGGSDFSPAVSRSLAFPSPGHKGFKGSPSAGRITVLIRAAEKTCWQGYVLSKPVDDCGSVRYNFNGAQTVYGANARKTSASHLPLELELLVDGSVVAKDLTSEPFGVVSVSGDSTAGSGGSTSSSSP